RSGNPGVRARPTDARRASMRPLQWRSGNGWQRAAGPRRSCRFNEAAPVKERKPDSPPVITQSIPGFNEAAPVKERKRLSRNAGIMTPSGFNEAAPVKERKRHVVAIAGVVEHGFNEAAPVKERKQA